MNDSIGAQAISVVQRRGSCIPNLQLEIGTDIRVQGFTSSHHASHCGTAELHSAEPLPLPHGPNDSQHIARLGTLPIVGFHMCKLNHTAFVDDKGRRHRQHPLAIAVKFR